jgi:hypothetical protein
MAIPSHDEKHELLSNKYSGVARGWSNEPQWWPSICRHSFVTVTQDVDHIPGKFNNCRVSEEYGVMDRKLKDFMCRIQGQMYFTTAITWMVLILKRVRKCFENDFHTSNGLITTRNEQLIITMWWMSDLLLLLLLSSSVSLYGHLSRVGPVFL